MDNVYVLNGLKPCYLGGYLDLRRKGLMIMTDKEGVHKSNLQAHLFQW